MLNDCIMQGFSAHNTHHQKHIRTYVSILTIPTALSLHIFKQRNKADVFMTRAIIDSLSFIICTVFDLFFNRILILMFSLVC